MSNSRNGSGRKKGNTKQRSVFSVGAIWKAASQLLTGHQGSDSDWAAKAARHAMPVFGLVALSGRVVDGYVRDGTVFYDANANGVREPGESTATTDDQGNFTLVDVVRTSGGRIVVEAGGIDIETGNAVGLLMAPDTDGLSGASVVSPLTLLVTLNPWLNTTDLKAVLGIPAHIDLLHYDPIAEMAAGGAGASVAETVFSAQQQVYAVIQAAAQAEAKDGKVDFASLQVAVTAVGAAVGNGAGTLAEVSHAVLTAIVADPAMAAQIELAVNDSLVAIATAYGGTDGGPSLSDARALVAAEDAAAAGFGEAVATVAAAKAAASVSQSGLLAVVADISAGGSYATGGLQPLLDDAFRGYQDQLAAVGAPMTALVSALVDPPAATPLESVSSHYQFTEQQITDLLPQGDAAFDTLIGSLQDRGMEVLDLTPEQITALAGADFTLNAGTDVSVTGTGFLHAGGVGTSAISALLSPADLTVHLSSQDLGQVIAAGDPAFDDLISQLQLSGMDHLDLGNSQIGALAEAGFTLNAGVDISVTGTGFLHAGNAGSVAIGALLSPADITVQLGNRDMAGIVARGDASFDELTDSLQQAGMDHLELSSNQVDALANAGITLNAGIDVTVTGTGFLHAAGVSPTAIGALLAPADVTVRLTDQDLGHLLQGGDAMLDAMVMQLQAGGMDHLELSAGQAATLAHEGFSFDAGTTVSVNGTGFLHATDVTGMELGNLLSGSDTTVHLTNQDLGHLLGDGDAAMDALMLQLQTAGMDHLALAGSQVIELANAHFSFDSGTAITVDGTGFLHTGGSTTHDLDTLLGAADVTVNLTAQDLGHVLAATHDATAITAVADHLHDAGVDTLGMSAYQAIELAHALSGVALTDLPLDVSIGDPLAFNTASDADLMSLNTLLGASDTTAELTMGELRQAQFGTLGDLQQAMDGMQHALTEGGIDHIDLSDELAHALAQANIAFLPSAAEGGTGQDIVVTANADNGAGTAYLEASLQQMQALGVDKVTVAAGVHKVEVAFGNEQGAAYTLDDLPHFQVAAGTEVDLVVTEDDLANLLLQGGSFDQLAELGITDLHYTGDTSSAAYQDAVAASALPIDPVTLTPVEVQLLGLGTQPTDPMDPFHKPA